MSSKGCDVGVLDAAAEYQVEASDEAVASELEAAVSSKECDVALGIAATEYQHYNSSQVKTG